MTPTCSLHPWVLAHRLYLLFSGLSKITSGYRVRTYPGNLRGYRVMGAPVPSLLRYGDPCMIQPGILGSTWTVSRVWRFSVLLVVLLKITRGFTQGYRLPLSVRRLTSVWTFLLQTELPSGSPGRERYVTTRGTSDRGMFGSK